MMTREEFEQFRINEAKKMSSDPILKQEMLDFLYKADYYSWIHQTNFMGEPSLQLPQDLFALQEITWKTHCNWLELGAAWAGTTLFLASIIHNFCPSKCILSVDQYIPTDLEKRIYDIAYEHDFLDKLHLCESDVLDIQKIKQQLQYCGWRDGQAISVICDSNHTKDHVLSELVLWSQIVPKGCYICICDTIIDELPPQNRQREWGPNNNPKQALDQFLKENTDFEIDQQLQDKLLLSLNSYIIRK